MDFLESDKKLGNVLRNIGEILVRNVERFPDKTAFRELVDGKFSEVTWHTLSESVMNISYNLQRIGVQRGEKMIVFSPNRLEMLELELALMSLGAITVPIFAYFKKEAAQTLIEHSNANYIAVAGEIQLSRITPNEQLKKVFVFDKVEDARFPGLIHFSDLRKGRNDTSFTFDKTVSNDDVCLNMYTSGTMGTPKCVQLTHGNILSQQAALSLEWDINEDDRFLSYLPWHHSFGGIFERFSALYNGAALALDPASGKDSKSLFHTWKYIQPTVFFSVPKVYQSLIDQTRQDKEAEELFFHSGLKFIFTAAASLPQKLSDEFEKRGVVVREGWGLTETSPCCTLTDPKLKRVKGVVGKPIAGVSIRLALDTEIQIKGPNVMKGYYHNDEANSRAFTDDGWFCTGDLGEITQNGLRLIARKDRVFKLVNGEKVVPSEVEMIIQGKCHYVSFAMVVGNGHEYPVALIFPNKSLFEHPDFQVSPEEGCFCPRSIDELGKCLHGCLGQVNCGIGEKFSRVKVAMVIDDELSIEKNTLTPSLKIAPNNVIATYRAHVENLYGAHNPIEEDVYVIRLDNDFMPQDNKPARHV